MDKISLPFRILLVVFLVFVVAWFAILRPKAAGDVEPAVTPAPGVTGLATATDKAKSAVDASQASAAANEAAANAVGDASTTTKPSSTSAKRAATATKTAKPAAATKAAKRGRSPPRPPSPPRRPSPPRPPSRPPTASPRTPPPATRRARCSPQSTPARWPSSSSGTRTPPTTAPPARPCARSTCHHGNVVASAVPLGDVGRYEAITRGAQVLESPTVLVIGAGGKARAITGYTETQEIDQAVSDIGGKGFELKKAFRLTGFAKVADDVCKDVGYNIDQKADPPTTVPALSKALGVASLELGRSRSRLAKAKASSSAERALKTALLSYVGHDVKWIADARAKLKAGAAPGTVFLMLVQLEVNGNKAFATAAKKVRARGCYASA